MPGATTSDCRQRPMHRPSRPRRRHHPRCRGPRRGRRRRRRHTGRPGASRLLLRGRHGSTSSLRVRHGETPCHKDRHLRRVCLPPSVMRPAPSLSRHHTFVTPTRCAVRVRTTRRSTDATDEGSSSTRHFGCPLPSTRRRSRTSPCRIFDNDVEDPLCSTFLSRKNGEHSDVGRSSSAALCSARHMARHGRQPRRRGSQSTGLSEAKGERSERTLEGESGVLGAGRSSVYLRRGDVA